MFGKLLKHDFLATGRIMVIVYAIFAVLSAYILGSFYLGDVSVENMGILETLSILLLVIGSVVNIILTIVVVMSHFQKSLYGDQGYLSFTLPVKSISILSSKLLISTFWYVLSIVALFGSLFIVGDAMSQSVGEEGLSLIDMLIGMFDENLNLGVLAFMLVCILINAFVSAFLYMVEVCFAITLSNTRHFQKHHVIFTLIFSAAAILIAGKISSVIADEIMLGVTFDVSGEELKFITDISDANISFINLMPSVVSIVFVVVFFFATHYVMSKKINLR